MTKAIVYIRVSTNEQADKGYSLGNQKKKCQAYCISQDYQIVETIVDDGKSAKDLYREGANKVLTMLENKEADTLVILKLDRLTRSVKDLGNILDHMQKFEWALVAVRDNLDTNTATGRLMLNLLTSVSQWEREITAERTAEALQHKRSKNEKTGGNREFGYEVAERKEDGKKVYKESQHEQKVIQLIKELKSNGMSLQAIAKELKKRKVKTVSGKTTWAVWTISKILKRNGVEVGKDRKTRIDKGTKKVMS